MSFMTHLFLVLVANRTERNWLLDAVVLFGPKKQGCMLLSRFLEECKLEINASQKEKFLKLFSH